MQITILDQTFLLLPQKAMYWEEADSLILADLHLGKATHFLKEGINITPGCGDKDLTILTGLLEEYRPSNIFILGDLFHSSFNKEWQGFEKVVNKFQSTDFILVQGNHDILPEEMYTNAGLRLETGDLPAGPFILSHKPMEDTGEKLNICGHIHPGIKLQGLARQSLRIPCFYLTNSHLIMPAFGQLTGLCILKKEKKAKAYAVTGNKVIEI